MEFMLRDIVVYSDIKQNGFQVLMEIIMLLNV